MLGGCIHEGGRYTACQLLDDYCSRILYYLCHYTKSKILYNHSKTYNSLIYMFTNLEKRINTYVVKLISKILYKLRELMR